MTQFDWGAMMRIGMRDLGLKPDEFWQLTPLEFMIISGFEGRRSAVMTRTDLRALCDRFPDTETE